MASEGASVPSPFRVARVNRVPLKGRAVRLKGVSLLRASKASAWSTSVSLKRVSRLSSAKRPARASGAFPP